MLTDPSVVIITKVSTALGLLSFSSSVYWFSSFCFVQGLHKFIDSTGLPDAEKQRLKELSPSTYLGLAESLARQVTLIWLPLSLKWILFILHLLFSCFIITPKFLFFVFILYFTHTSNCHIKHILLVPCCLIINNSLMICSIQKLTYIKKEIATHIFPEVINKGGGRGKKKESSPHCSEHRCSFIFPTLYIHKQSTLKVKFTHKNHTTKRFNAKKCHAKWMKELRV